MDLVTLGEALVVFSPADTGPLRFVHNFTKSIGGAEANVAIALARLGHQVGWISRLGDDEFGRYVRHALLGEGIDLSQLSIDAELPSGILFKELYHNLNPNIYYYRHGAAITSMGAQYINSEYIAQASYLHVTGILPALSSLTHEAVFAAIASANQAGVAISFDPNLRLKLWRNETEARSVLLEMAARADIIFPGLDEAKFLLGTERIDEIVARFHDLGCRLIVLKLGKDGCLVSDTQQLLRIAGFSPHRFIDSVGAGDGFAAGFLSGLLHGKSLIECAEMANGVGAMATMVRGDSEAYPTQSQLLAFMGKTSAIER